MPPKIKYSNIYVVASSAGVDSVYSDVDAAQERVLKVKSDGHASARVEVHSLIGTTTVAPAAEDKKSVPAKNVMGPPSDTTTPAKSKAEAKPKETKTPKETKPKEPKSESKAKAKDETKAKTESANAASTNAPGASSAPAPTTSTTNAPTTGTAAPPAKMTAKTPSADEQRAANAKKGTPAADEDLPPNVQSLLNSTSKILKGLTVVVTGVPPTIGRKNAEKLVESHGAKLGKSITAKTGLVVLGADAGPRKLESIKDHGIETVDEKGLIAKLEAGGSGNTGTTGNTSSTAAAPSAAASSGTAAAPSASPSKKRSADESLVKKSTKKAKE